MRIVYSENIIIILYEYLTNIYLSFCWWLFVVEEKEEKS